MTQVEDEKPQAWLAGGLRTAQTDEREAEQLQSILLSAGRGRGGGEGAGGRWSSQGSTVTLCILTQTQKRTTFPAAFGGDVCVCVRGVVVVVGEVGGLSSVLLWQHRIRCLFPPSHMSRCEQTQVQKVLLSHWSR